MCSFLEIVLGIFDYLLTLPLEVAEIWKGKITLSRTIFLVNRYSFLLAFTFYAVFFLSIGDETDDVRHCHLIISKVEADDCTLIGVRLISAP